MIDLVGLVFPGPPLRPAAPPTREIRAFRARAMMWCALAIVMLLTNMTLKGRPMLAVMTALVVVRAVWILCRYLRRLYLADLVFWTPARSASWDGGQRDMAVIAAIVDPSPIAALCAPDTLVASTSVQPLSPAMPVPEVSSVEAAMPVPLDSCCCARRQRGGPVP